MQLRCPRGALRICDPHIPAAELIWSCANRTPVNRKYRPAMLAVDLVYQVGDPSRSGSGSP
jgi:hypothetical protein